MAIDCTVTGPPVVAITSPLGAGGTTNITGTAGFSEVLCKANGDPVVLFWNSVAGVATAGGWYDVVTNTMNGSAHPTGLVNCAGGGGGVTDVELVGSLCIVNTVTGATVGRAFIEASYNTDVVPYTYNGMVLTAVLTNGTFVRNYVLPANHILDTCASTSTSDFFRAFYDCTPAGVCVKFYRWYDGVTRLATTDLTAAGGTYTILGTVSETSCDAKVVEDSVHECNAGICTDLIRVISTDCNGLATTSYLTTARVVTVPVGVISDNCCVEHRVDYRDVFGGRCITVSRVTNSCGTVSYVRQDGSAWTPTVALTEGACNVNTTVTNAVSSTSVLGVGGTAQEILAANPSRIGFEFQNSSSLDMRLAFGSVASSTNGFIISPNGTYTTPANVLSGLAISVFGTTTGQEYSIIEYD